MARSASFLEEKHGLPNIAMGVDGTMAFLTRAPRECDLPPTHTIDSMTNITCYLSFNTKLILAS